MKHQPQSSPMGQRVSRLLAVPLTLATLMGGGSLWLLEMAIAPPAAQAYTARVNLNLDRRANESYDTLLRRAEAAARAAAQRAFDNDILATEVSVIVAGQNSGLIVPILALEVSRADWRRRPDPQQWATYYSNADLLLGISQPAIAAPAPAPAPVPVPTPTAPPVNLPGAAPAQTETAPAAGEGPADPNVAAPATTAPGAAPPAQVQPGEAPAPGTAAPGDGTAAPGTAAPGTTAPGAAPAPTNAAPAPTNAAPTPPPGAAPAPASTPVPGAAPGTAPAPTNAAPAPQQQTAPAPTAPAPTTTAPQPRSAVVCSGGTCRTVEQR